MYHNVNLGLVYINFPQFAWFPLLEVGVSSSLVAKFSTVVDMETCFSSLKASVSPKMFCISNRILKYHRQLFLFPTSFRDEHDVSRFTQSVLRDGSNCAMRSLQGH